MDKQTKRHNFELEYVKLWEVLLKLDLALDGLNLIGVGAKEVKSLTKRKREDQNEVSDRN